jgi:pSer/pThr/pTyr-binding forkhead associated (FHA) protein
VHGASEYDRPVEVRRPYAVIGRAPGCDVVLDDHAIAPAHVYLHLDHRGLFAVDLATRAGSRVGPLGADYGWLRPGELIEIAGYHIELAALHLDELDPAGPGDADPLCDIADGPGLALYPDGGGMPLFLRSQLIFAGRSEACGVRIDDPRLAPVQCALIRSDRSAYVVDLAGGGATRLGERPLRGAAEVCDGDVLSIGAARFECRVDGLPIADADWAPAYQEPAPPVPYNGPRTTDNAQHLPRLSRMALDRLAGADQESVLAWMMGALQATHEEMLRRQDEFRRDVMRALRKLHKQQTLGHEEQIERLGQLNQEVSTLRDEVRKRYGSAAPVPRPETPRALPSVPIPPLPSPAATIDDTDAWLSRRIHQINRENQAARRTALKK